MKPTGYCASLFVGDYYSFYPLWKGADGYNQNLTHRLIPNIEDQIGNEVDTPSMEREQVFAGRKKVRGTWEFGVLDLTW